MLRQQGPFISLGVPARVQLIKGVRPIYCLLGARVNQLRRCLCFGYHGVVGRFFNQVAYRQAASTHRMLDEGARFTYVRGSVPLQATVFIRRDGRLVGGFIQAATTLGLFVNRGTICFIMCVGRRALRIVTHCLITRAVVNVNVGDEHDVRRAIGKNNGFKEGYVAKLLFCGVGGKKFGASADLAGRFGV